MPLYDYTCASCGWQGTRIVAMTLRDEAVCHNLVERRAGTLSPCSAALTRTEISDVAPARIDHRHQTKAILSNGAKIPGHFGVEAKKNRGRY
jgi:hypothetical protein